MTGLAKDAGWQVGARRTVPMEGGKVWALLTSQPWLARWSGLSDLDPCATAVRSFEAERLARVRTPDSLVQLRLLPAASGTTVAFHEDHLPDERTRTVRKRFWAQFLDDFDEEATAG